MKKTVSAVLCVLMLALLLSACTGNVKFETYENGKLINTKTKGVFTATPVGYEPCGVGEQYGSFGEFPLYSVEDQNGNAFSTDEWLTEEYSGTATTLFYGEGAVFAPIEEMDPDICYICLEDQNVLSVASFQEKDVMSRLITLMNEGEKHLWPRSDVTESYTLKFYSQDHPQYYFSVNYVVTEEGNFIHRSGSDGCVEIGDLLSGYLEGVSAANTEGAV